MPRRREDCRFFWVAPTFVLTKKEPMMEEMLPIAAISMGITTPPKPSPAAAASAPEEMTEPT